MSELHEVSGVWLSLLGYVQFSITCALSGACYLSLNMVVDICVLMTLMLIFFFLMRAIVPIFLLESVLSPTKIGAPVTVPAIHDHEKPAGNLCSLSEHLLRTEHLSDRVS